MMLQRGLQLSSAAPTCTRPVVTTTNSRGVRQLTAATPSRSSSSKTTSSAKDVLVPSSRTSSPSEVQRGVWAWPDIDASRKLALACSLAFVLSNMDKTNFTIAVIPMGLEMGWSSTTAGLVQSSFFWGFLLMQQQIDKQPATLLHRLACAPSPHCTLHTLPSFPCTLPAMQLPASILSSRFGGSNVLPKGLAVWSGATALIPFVAGSMPGLCLTRALMGAGEAVAPSAIVDMISRTVPPAKRASAVSFAYGGLHAGSLVGLLASPAIIQAVGWPAVFYSFGAVGGLWLLAFAALVRNIQASDPQLAAKLQPLLAPSAASTGSSKARSAASLTHNQQQQQQEQGAGIPYRALLRHRGVHVLMATHFAHNWHSFTMLAWLPTYFTSALSVDLMHAAQTALLPPLAGLAASTAAGLLGDSLLARGMPTSSVRKLMQTTAFLAPAAFLAYAAQLPCTVETSTTIVACITGALGLSSFSLAGLYCSHQDMSPKYASVLLGLTNLAGSLPGIVGVATVGLLYDATDSWPIALFLPSGVLMLGGAAVFGLYSQHEPVDFDALDNSPFAIERQLQRAWRGSGAAGVLAGAQAYLAPSWAKMQRMREVAARKLSRWGASGQAVGARLVAKLGVPAGDGGEGGVEAPGGQQQAAGRAREPRAQPASQTVRKSQWGQLGGSRAARRQGNSADSGSKGDRQ
ncbi:hypothetical protein QJQ45_025290 [Haematococcus lacustris]|nr:hypothetical protein QJQ45_025290 [Haematococcus lacustris]